MIGLKVKQSAELFLHLQAFVSYLLLKKGVKLKLVAKGNNFIATKSTGKMDR